MYHPEIRPTVPKYFRKYSHRLNLWPENLHPVDHVDRLTRNFNQITGHVRQLEQCQRKRKYFYCPSPTFLPHIYHFY